MLIIKIIKKPQHRAQKNIALTLPGPLVLKRPNAGLSQAKPNLTPVYRKLFVIATKSVNLQLIAYA
jgi:hypothetical protein